MRAELLRLLREDEEVRAAVNRAVGDTGDARVAPIDKGAMECRALGDFTELVGPDWVEHGILGGRLGNGLGRRNDDISPGQGA